MEEDGINGRDRAGDENVWKEEAKGVRCGTNRNSYI